MMCGSPAFGNELRYRNDQTDQLDGAYVPVDFALNGASYGAASFKAHTAGELRSALDRARSEPKTCVIHVPIDKDERVPGFESWWDVPIAEVSDEATVNEALATYNQSRKRQRFLF
jgi:3D-(3,5/4)-trihydroxycyclohexane-1,2-dione acylhydrolase (decyclizing)